jgi:outer membrane biogenesis lipoprotein LolB
MKRVFGLLLTALVLLTACSKKTHPEANKSTGATSERPATTAAAPGLPPGSITSPNAELR